MSKFTISVTPPDEHKVGNAFDNILSSNNNEIIFESIEEEIVKRKKPREIYMRELGKVNQYNASFNKEMKALIESIHKIKKDIIEKKNKAKSIDGDLSSKEDKQKSLLSSLSKMAQRDKKIEEEIITNMKEIEELKKEKSKLNLEIKHLYEEDLFNFQSKQLEMLKEKKNTIELCISNFDIIKRNTAPLLKTLSSDTSSFDAIQKELTELKEKSNKDEEVKKKLKEEISKKLLETTKYQESLLEECEKLRIALDEKMKQTIAVNQSIMKANYYLELIDKYGESYISIDSKEKEYNEKKKIFDDKHSEFEDVLNRIEIFNKKYTQVCDTLEENISSMENFINIEIIQSEQIQNYNSEIAELRERINENEEKIEILDLEHKALEAEISPLSLKITKFESEKKFIINKKQFDELQSLYDKINEMNIEKKKFQEKIKKVQEDISALEGNNMKLLNEIDNKTKLYVDIDSELRTEKVHYLKCYESILNELPGHMKSPDIQEEVKLIAEELDELNDEFREDNNVISKRMTMRLSNIEFPKI